MFQAFIAKLCEIKTALLHIHENLEGNFRRADSFFRRTPPHKRKKFLFCKLCATFSPFYPITLFSSDVKRTRFECKTRVRTREFFFLQLKIEKSSISIQTFSLDKYFFLHSIFFFGSQINLHKAKNRSRTRSVLTFFFLP